MIKIEHTQVFGWEAAIRGMRNPMNSWEKSDSHWNGNYNFFNGNPEWEIGPNDHDLMMRLVKAGDEHAKFMRMIHVSMDILAPLYWWKQADTYKVGFVTNSCSTMHKIQEKEFELEDFSFDHILNYDGAYYEPYKKDQDCLDPHKRTIPLLLSDLNMARRAYLATKDKKYWWVMIQLLPDSYNQLRTCDTNYATLRKMYHQRKGHKLDEWNDFRAWVEKLPYSELIMGNPTRKRDTFADALEEYMTKKG